MAGEGTVACVRRGRRSEQGRARSDAGPGRSRRYRPSQHKTDDDDVDCYMGKRLELEGETENSTWHKTDDSGAPRTGGVGLDVLCALYDMSRREQDARQQAVGAAASASVGAERLEARRQSLSLRAAWRKAKEVQEGGGLTSGASGVLKGMQRLQQEQDTCGGLGVHVAGESG